MEMLHQADTVRLHWVVDLRGNPAGQVSDPTSPKAGIDDPAWWDCVQRLKSALDAQSGFGGIETQMALTLAHYTYPTNKPVNSTFKLGYRCKIEHFMRLPPPIGKWMLWPAWTTDPRDRDPSMWWYDDIPF